MSLQAGKRTPISFALLASGLCLLIYWFHPVLLESLDLRARDIVYSLRETPHPAPNVVVVSVDEKSVALHGRWPWSRALQGELITKLGEAGVRVVGLDIVYSSTQDEENDSALRDAVTNARSEVIGGYFFRHESSVAVVPRAVEILEKSRLRTVLSSQQARHDTVLELPFVETSIPPILEAFSGLGFFNYFPDPDGLLRNVPLVMGYGDAYYPALSLQALSMYLGQPLALSFGVDGIESIQIGEKLIPVDRLGRMALGFYASDKPIVIHSAADVLQGALASQALQDKLVFVGVTELGIADVRPTPVEKSFPGVAAHATAASNIIQEYYLIRDSRTVLIDVLLIAGMPLVLLLAVGRLRSLVIALLVFIAGACGFGWLYYWLVAGQGWLISLVYPATALAIAFITHQIYYNLVVQHQARFLRQAFSSYVSPDLVERIIDDPGALTLAGEKRVITTLFSDIRGFTTLSEAMTPEALVAMLNQYMGAMTDIIMSDDGTLDKYIGDALMALYNAPLDVTDHSRKAADSALAMVARLKLMNRRFSSEFGQTLAMGVGIHTGEAIVGNLGSTRRFDYTAIGDNVNLASRLEGATKMYGVTVIVSDVVYAALKGNYICRELDRIRVKGRKEHVTAYELMGRSGDSALQKKASDYGEILELYYEQVYSEAITRLEAYLQDYPDDGPASMLVKRCADYKENPPSEDWGGVYVATSK